MSSMIEKIKNNKFSIKNIISLVLYALLFWLLIGYIVLPICNTFVQAFQSDGRFSLDVFKDYLSNSNNLRVISNTFILGIGSVIVCAILGI